MAGLRRMPKRNPRLAGLRRCEACSGEAATTIPTAVEARIREVPLAIVPKSLHGGPPGGVNRSVIPCVASTTRSPAWIVDATSAVDLID